MKWACENGNACDVTGRDGFFFLSALRQWRKCILHVILPWAHTKGKRTTPQYNTASVCHVTYDWPADSSYDCLCEHGIGLYLRKRQSQNLQKCLDKYYNFVGPCIQRGFYFGHCGKKYIINIAIIKQLMLPILSNRFNSVLFFTTAHSCIWYILTVT